MKFSHISSDKGLPHSTVHGIAKDKYGFMWFGTWSGICRYDGYKFKVYRYDPANTRSIVNSRIHNILKDEHGDLWILTFDEQYICRYNYETDDFDRIPQSEVSPEFLYKITRRNHLMNVNFTYQDFKWQLDTYTNSVVETFLPTGKQKTYFTNPIDIWSINDTYLSDIYLDNQNILWFGTYSNGINKVFLEANPFHYRYHDPNNSNSIIENTIRAIAEDKAGNLWIGTRKKGITRITKDGQFQHFQHSTSNPNTIQSNYIKTIYCDSKGLTWIGSQRGIDIYNPATRQVKRLVDDRLAELAIYGFEEDKNHNIWIASWNGIFKYDRQQDKLIHFDPNRTLSRRFVWTIMIDSKGQLWAGTEGEGITVLREGNNGQIIPVLQLAQHNLNNALSDKKVYNIFEDSEHLVWIATGNGLDRYNPESKKIENLSLRQDFPKGTISGITEDELGYIWVSHKKGISRINKKNLSIRTFSQQDGLQSNEFAEGAIFRSLINKTLYFGSNNNGINYFRPDSIKIDNTPPIVVLTEIQIQNHDIQVNEEINGRVLLKKPLHLTKAIDLIHQDKSISIEFAALHYSNPSANKYAYMLEGFDKDWIYTDASKRVAYYSNLEAGHYTFKVKASNSDGVWTAEPITMTVNVAPPWWFNTLAYFIYALVLIAILTISYFYVIRYTKLKSKLAYEAILHEKERELHRNKVDFFTNISHEIKTPLTLILSPIQQLNKTTQHDPVVSKQLDTMKKNGDRLMKIVNQLLDIRRLESGYDDLQLSRKDIVAFIKESLVPFKELAASKHISMDLVQKVNTCEMWFDTDKMEKVLNNLVSNAIKFTHTNGKITVSLDIETDNNIPYFTIEVKDNGIGIHEDSLPAIFTPFTQSKVNNPSGSGLGLAYSKTLVELHGGSIQANSTTLPGGENSTVFKVKLPTALGHQTDNQPFDTLSERAESVKQLEISPLDQLYPSTSNPDTEKSTILILEDNDEMRDYLTTYFSQYYHVIEAPNGSKGLDLARKHIPDLIISDVMMPEMDGITFATQIKQDITVSHIPVILLTARSLQEFELEGLKSGADDYIVKPFNLDILALKVKNQLAYRLRMQEKYQLRVAITPSEIDVQSPDELLLQKILRYVEDNITNPDLKIETICNEIGMSRTQLYRKMKALTGYSMADLVREIRLKRAEQLLKDKKLNINEISYMVGFMDTDYFRKCFKNKFGESPSEYAKRYQ